MSTSVCGANLTNQNLHSSKKFFTNSDQSPIDLVPLNPSESEQVGGVKFDLGLSTAVECTWNPKDVAVLQNVNGYTWTLSMKDHCKSYMAASHLPGRKFRMLQLHAHWGNDSSDGSEHRLDGQGYAGELHFVHINAKYTSLNEAMMHSDGLAVLAVFLQEVPSASAHHTPSHFTLSKITDLLGNIKTSGSNYPLQTNKTDISIDLTSLLPSQTWQFATYFGSLTTPPFSECVTWTVLTEPLLVESALVVAELLSPAPLTRPPTTPLEQIQRQPPTTKKV